MDNFIFQNDDIIPDIFCRLDLDLNTISPGDFFGLIWFSNIHVAKQRFLTVIIISYCVNTIKCWLRVIFEENELASYILILHKANILWY